MRHLVLGIGYDESERLAVEARWRDYGVQFHFAEELSDAAQKIARESYLCVSLCSDSVNLMPYISVLREIKPVPIVVMSPKHNAEQRALDFRNGAGQLIIEPGNEADMAASGKDSVQHYLGLEQKADEPITIITNKDIFFIMEYRIVKVRGQDIDLTPIEFDIFSLLITRPKRVFTYDMIVSMVWGEEYVENSRQMLWIHMSRLRKKLNTSPDVPQYIKNVHGVGYKYDPDAG